ncbi:hypothetical protein PVAP13_5KG255900 [Panicum virgatum]|uniref:Uncharacterized protein n=1 Tax=Panicum virgatum TaxID=38727 RepID=A0A8T0SDN2_PANVG|nr:hypothetical protein PVAP13_5KG255900 [Panicum virgatum]
MYCWELAGNDQRLHMTSVRFTTISPYLISTPVGASTGWSKMAKLLPVVLIVAVHTSRSGGICCALWELHLGQHIANPALIVVGLDGCVHLDCQHREGFPSHLVGRLEHSGLPMSSSLRGTVPGIHGDGSPAPLCCPPTQPAESKQ